MIRLLLRIYPRQWRAEYGEEMTAMLASKPLRLAILLNVIGSGLRERLRSSDPARVCSLVSSLVCIGAMWAQMHYHAPSVFTWFGILVLITATSATTSVWNVVRGNGARESSISALRGAITLSILAGQAFWRDPSRSFCGTGGVPGCGITTLFFQSALHPSLYLQLLVFFTALAAANAGGMLAGLALGRFKKTQI